MFSFASKISLFFNSDLWRIDLRPLSARRAFVIKCLRIIVLAVRGFVQDNCSLRASSLTLNTLLSIVPVLAMAFGFAKGFGLETAIERQILEGLRGQEEVANWIIGFSYSLLRTTKGGVIAGVGVAGLIVTVINVLRNIEGSFNAIWKTNKQRTISRTITDYLAVVIIAPFLFIIASSLTVVITKQVSAVGDEFRYLEYISPLLAGSVKLLPFCVMWILFTFIYVSMPNTQVHLSSGIVGGIFAGTMYQVFQWLYISFQVGVTKYNAIYGSFAALPLFIVWLQSSWLIALLGAEISYAHQNAPRYELEVDVSKISHSFRVVVALNICHLVIKKFQSGERCCTLRQISQLLQIPRILAQEVIADLLKADLVSATVPLVQTGHGKESADEEVIYQPASSIDRYNIKYVVDALERQGIDDLPGNEGGGKKEIGEKLKALNDISARAPENVLLKDL